jgi:membrane protein DedA with SNARE-associated domain
MPAYFQPFVGLLAQYRYGALFSVALFEGVGTTLATGVFVSLGLLNFWYALGIILVSDLISDSTLYLLGRFGRVLVRRLPFLQKSERHLERLERHYNKHPLQTLAIGKVSYGLSGAFIVAAGGAKLPYWKFIPRAFVLDAAKASLLLGIGWYFGRKALRFRQFLPYYALAIVIIVPLTYYLWYRLRRRRNSASL